MSGKYVFIGDFKGSFYTLQDTVLGSAEKRPLDDKHAVRVYKGVLTNAEAESIFNPEKYTKLNSFNLLNVPNIQIHTAPSSIQPFNEKRVYNFAQFLLIEPKVYATYLHNGKTYGEIESKAYGITEDNPIHKLDGDDIQPFLVDEHFNQDINSESEEKFIKKIPEGCGKLLNGCFSNFKRILFYLALILLIIWMLKSCQSEDECTLKEIAKYRLEKAKKHLDSTKSEYNKNLKEALSDISTIYFYQNSADIHMNSSGNNSPISKLAILMAAYSDKQFYIEGYHSGVKLEKTKNIDIIRAETLKNALLEKGVNLKNLKIIGMGDKIKKVNSDNLSKFFISTNNYRYYNRNMRAEVKIRTKP